MLTHAPWLDVPGLRHGYLGRDECGGASDWAPVVARAGATAPIATARQVHGVGVVEGVRGGVGAEGDVIVAARPGTLVGVVTADCVPVLLVDPRRRVAAAGVLEAAIEHLVVNAGVERATIEAAIGPAIGGCCYVVGDEVHAAFAARTGETTARAWTRRGDRWSVDLRTAARLLLEAAGIPTIATLGPCTACGSGYHSYRRDGVGTGRQLSFVGWP